MIVKIYDTTEKLRASAEVYDFRHLREINKLDELTGYLLEPIDKGERILYKHKTGKWYEFIVDEPNIIHEDGTRYYFTALDSLCEIHGDWIEDKRPATLSAAVVAVLEPTRWTMGTVTSKPDKLLTFYRKTAREALDDILAAYPVEFQTRITVGPAGVVTRTLDILDRVGGDYGKRYVYDKDVTSVKRRYGQGKVVTALYGFGKGEEVGDGYGRRIDFSAINGGKAYVEDPAILALYGRMNGSTRAHVYDYVVFNDVSDKAELLALTTAEYYRRCYPQVSYEASVIDLGLDHENVGIGDTVKVIDGDHRFETRVNYLLETEDEGNQARLANYIKNITETNNDLMKTVGELTSHAGVWDQSQKIADGSYLDGLIDILNSQANATGGWTFIEDGNGILTIDAPTEAAATKAVNIVGGTVRVASYKNPDGSWKWRTFITGEVIAADLITAGILKGGKVNWNLETGVLYIGDSPATAKLIWDGSSLIIAQGALKLYYGGIEITDASTDILAKHMAAGAEYIRKSTGNPIASYAADGANLDQLTAVKIYSPHVANKVGDAVSVYVVTAPTGDGSGRDASNKASSLDRALQTALDGAMVIEEDVTVYVSGKITEALRLKGFSGGGRIIVQGRGQITGQISVINCSCRVDFNLIDVVRPDISATAALISVVNSCDVRVNGCRLDGYGVGTGIGAYYGGGIYATDCDIVKCEYAYDASVNARIAQVGCRGKNNLYVGNSALGSNIVLSDTRPIATNIKRETAGGVITDASSTGQTSTFAATPATWQTVSKTFTGRLSTANRATGYVWKTGTWTQGTWDGTAQRGYADFGTSIKDWLDSAGGYQNISSVIVKAHRNATSGGGSVSLKIASPSAQSLPAVARGGTSQASLVSGLVAAMTSGALKLSSSTTATADYAGFDRIEIIITADKKA